MISRVHKLGFVAVLLALPLAGHSAPSKSTNAAPQQNIQSTFLMPKTPAEGRDPFFPNAMSLYRTTVAVTPVQESGVSLLKLKSILGSSLAQINNMTLAIGETEDVKTAVGPVSVRLIEIHPADETVVIEANGQRRVVGFGGSSSVHP